MTFRPIAKVVLLAGLSVSAIYPAHAQSAVDGAIGGAVEDATGAIIPKAAVVILNNDTNAEQTLTADDSGFFSAVHLAPGTYTVIIRAEGFEGYKSTKVKVTVGSLTNVAPRLAPDSATETVEVSRTR